MKNGPEDWQWLKHEIMSRASVQQGRRKNVRHGGWSKTHSRLTLMAGNFNIGILKFPAISVQDQLFIFLYTVTLHSYFLQISFSPTRGPNNLLNTRIINDTHSLADEANMAD